MKQRQILRSRLPRKSLLIAHRSPTRLFLRWPIIRDFLNSLSRHLHNPSSPFANSPAAKALRDDFQKVHNSAAFKLLKQLQNSRVFADMREMTAAGRMKPLLDARKKDAP
jgi:hypothetical protein